MKVNASGTDVDYIDPSLAYGTISWQILDSVCTKLMYYPDKPDPARGPARARRCRRLPVRFQGRQDLRVHGQDRH